MPYRIAGVDVHKKMLAVAVADVEVEGEWRFDRRQFGTRPSQLRALAEWFVECEVEEVVTPPGTTSTTSRWPVRCTSRRRSPTMRRAAVRKIFRMRNDW